MDGRRPRDWDRFERVGRVWSRKFERDMRDMGERIERDIKDSCRFAGDAETEAGQGRRDCRDTHVMWAWDMSPRQRRAARRAARSAAHAAAEGVARGFAGGAAPAERNDSERGDRERSERRAKRCGPGGWWASYWWVLFPLFFVGKNAFEDGGGWAGFWGGLSGAVDRSIGSSLELTLAAPLAHLLERLIGVSFVEAYAMLALAAVLSVAAGVIGWRMGRPPGEAHLAQ